MPKKSFRMIAHVDRATLAEMYREYSPVFILSTGRAGSRFLALLSDCTPNVTAFHEPRPTFQYFSDYAFHHQREEEILTNMIDAGRMESILEVFIKGNIYVESNQCLTFFAPVISKLYEKSKFVHVVRHPGDFVRSAIRKGWHKNDSIWEAGRVKAADRARWDKMDQIQRLSWVWETTNRFIHAFMNRLTPGRGLTKRFEDLVNDTGEIRELLAFMGAGSIETAKIKEMQAKRVNELHIHAGEPPNMKKVSDFPPYREWDEEMKDKLKAITRALAKQYNYKL